MTYIRSWYSWETQEVRKSGSVDKDYTACEMPEDMDREAFAIAKEDWQEQGYGGEFDFEYWEEISADEFDGNLVDG